MFEPPKETTGVGTKRFWVISVITLALLAVAALLYISMPPGAEAPGVSSPQLAAIGDADPLQDLRVTHASLGKDYTGTKAVWKVRIQNKSSVYTYTDIEYEASYIAADDAVLALSQGTIEADVAPSEEKQISDLEDILYPVGTVRYEFRLTGAKATLR